jgi:hypothetical protein
LTISLNLCRWKNRTVYSSILNNNNNQNLTVRRSLKYSFWAASFFFFLTSFLHSKLVRTINFTQLFKAPSLNLFGQSRQSRRDNKFPYHNCVAGVF